MAGGLPRFSGRAFLAPMAGVSDPAMRLVCRRRGAALAVTEFTSAHSVVARGRAACPVQYSEEESPRSVQLFGSDLAALEGAARIVGPHFDIIDYNMGCPAPHITRQMAGGALLCEPGLTRRIFRALVGATDRPVTLKMRAGAAPGSGRLFAGIARIAEEEGISMITLHPRTVSQGYSGRSDWSLIRELKRMVRVPVVGNGDVSSPEDARDMIGQTGCDYVMVGRAAMGNPGIFGQINALLAGGRGRAPGAAERLDAFFEYMGEAARFGIRLRDVRAQAMRFTRGLPGASALRVALSRAGSAAEVAATVRRAAGGLPEGGAPPVSCSSTRAA